MQSHAPRADAGRCLHQGGLCHRWGQSRGDDRPAPQATTRRMRCLLVSRPGRSRVHAAAGDKSELWPMPYRRETSLLLDSLITRQSVKVLLHFLGETNGEAHLWLNEHLATHGPPKVDAEGSATRWLAHLGSQPLAKVSDPGRASAPSPAAVEQALHGVREVSPRDILSRILQLRLELAKEARGTMPLHTA